MGPCRVCWVCDFVSDISLCHLSRGVLEVKRTIEPVDGLALSCGPVVMSVYIVELCVFVGGILLLSGHELF